MKEENSSLFFPKYASSSHITFLTIDVHNVLKVSKDFSPQILSTVFSVPINLLIQKFLSFRHFRTIPKTPIPTNRIMGYFFIPLAALCLDYSFA